MGSQSEDVRELIDRAVFEERDRIARDLHDLVIQRLFAIGLGIKALGRHQPEELDGFVEDIDQTIRDIRSSIFFLQQRANTAPSLRGEVLRAISEAGMSLGYEPTVRLEGPLDSVVPPDAHIDLVATLRESLSNVVRHADAGKVWVTVSVDVTAERLEMLVKDNGRGLPHGQFRHSGLTNMAHRAHRLGGRCHIYTAQEGGTRVFWAVPLNMRLEWARTGTGARPVEAAG